MAFKFNPFSGTFDLAGSKVDTYLDGEVATYDDLPLDTAAAPLNSAWLVREASGLWFLTRKPAGIYVRSAAGGTDRDADYTYAGTFPDVFSDANFVVYNDADSTKNVKFSAANVTTGTTRTLTVPDKSGTLATTDASDLTTGTLADARLSTNVPLLDAANTFSANQTFSGTNNVMPNQTTAASGSSIMTRDLVDNEFFRRVNKYSEHEIYTFTTAMLTTIGGSASVVNVTGGADAPAWAFRPNATVASANNYQALIGPYLQLSNGTVRSVKNWSKRSALSLRHKHVSSGGTTRYYWGPQASTWAGGALAVRGIGFEIVNNSVFATCHDGTTKTTAVTGVAMSNLIFYGLHIESDGAGGVRWWVDGVEQAALTGGPTGNSAGSSQFGFCTEAVNPDPAASTFVHIQYLRLASAN
jgi:hypothetical protein